MKKPANMQKSPTAANPLSKPNMNTKAPHNPNAPQFNQNQPRFQQRPGLTEEQVKAVVMATLIEFGLVPKTKKRKVIKIE